MSKYHERIAAAAKHDWTTVDGVAAGLRNGLELEGYGTKFQIFQDGLSVGEEAARQAIVDEITAPPVIGRYQQAIQRMMDDDPKGWRNWSMFVEAGEGALMFEHGDFQQPIRLDGLEIVVGEKQVERRFKNRPKRETKKEEKAEKLRRKLDDTRDTDAADYLAHANHCGYLLRRTTIRFNSVAKDQFGTSVMTRIGGITLSALRDFIDSTGKATLSMISTHQGSEPTEYADDGRGRAGIEAMHHDFARGIIDFLNLEYEVDTDAIARQHREDKSDSGFRSIEHWGGGRETVLNRLIERRPDLDSDEITEWFGQGYDESNLV